MKGRGEFDAVVLGLDRQDTDIDIGRSLPPSLTGEDPTQKLARDYALNGLKSRPEPKVKALQRFLVDHVEACLSEKGYVRFALTPAQAAELGGYRKGSQARFRYLHALASREAVIQHGWSFRKQLEWQRLHARLLRQQALQQLQGGVAVGRQSRTALIASDCAARGRPHHPVRCATVEAALVQGRLERRQLLA
jgi:hypothetical protein